MRNAPSPAASLLPILLLTVLAPAPQVARAQEPAADLRAFLPASVGDLWTFLDRKTAAPYATTISSDEPTATGRWLRRDDADGGYLLQRSSTEGLLIHSRGFPGAVEQVYDEPLLLVPARLSVGETHEVEVGFTETALDEEVGRGTERLSVRRRPDAEASTPAGSFRDVVVLDVSGELSGPDGTPRSWSETLWLARGVGLIRRTGTPRPAPAGDGAEVDLVLTGARVGGRAVEPAADAASPDASPRDLPDA